MATAVAEALAYHVLSHHRFLEDAVYVVPGEQVVNGYGEVTEGAVTRTALRLVATPVTGQDRRNAPEGIRDEVLYRFYIARAVNAVQRNFADGDILEYDGSSFRAYKAYNWQTFSEVWGVRQGDAQTTLGGFLVRLLVRFRRGEGGLMAVRSQTAMKSQIDTLLADNETGSISEADLRSVLTDLNDTLFHEAGGGTPVVADHSRYFGWSDDQTIETADFSSADEQTDNTGVLPARSGFGYVWFAVPQDVGYPRSLWIGDNALFPAAFDEQAGTVDDANGSAHLVGFTQVQQGDAVAGERVEIRY